MARGKTLWEMLVEYFQSGPVELRFYNPLKAKVGSFVTFDEFDLKDLDFRVEELRESRRDIRGREFLSADYGLLARPLGKPEVPVRLRLNPVENPERAGGLTHYALLLRLDDEMAFTEDLHNILRDGTGEFRVLEDGEVKAVFTRVGGVLEPYRVRVAVVRDANFDQKVEKDEVERREIESWDYERETTGDGGVVKKEYLFVEMDRETGWFQIWRGHETDMQRALVV